jgi:hypothetical protein
MCSYLHQEKFEDTKYVIRSNESKKDRQYNGENEEDRTTTLHRKLKSEQYKPYKIFIEGVVVLIRIYVYSCTQTR